MDSITLASIYTNGLNSPGKRSSLLRLLWAEKNRMAFIQETHFQGGSVFVLLSPRLPDLYHSCYSDSKFRGVNLLVSRSIPWKFTVSLRDAHEAFMMAWTPWILFDGSRTMESMSNSIEQLSSDLMTEIKKTNSGKNIVISPVGFYSALSSLWLGSGGDTAKQIEKVLHLPETQTPPTNEFRDLLHQLNSPKSGSELTIVNAAFTPQGVPLSKANLKPPFLKCAHIKLLQYILLAARIHNASYWRKSSLLVAEVAEDYVSSAQELYQTTVKAVDYQHGKASEEINSLVEAKTEGKIKNVIPENSLDISTSMVLVNAVYLKGQFAKKFNPANTKNAPFYTTKDSQISVPMMNQCDVFNFGEIKEINAKVIEIPFIDNKLSMFIVLPDECSSLDEQNLPNATTAPQINSRPFIHLIENDIAKELPKPAHETATESFVQLLLVPMENLMDPESVMKWTNAANMTPTRVDLQIPRVHLHIEIIVVKNLTDIGVQDVFSPEKADLSYICDQGLHVSHMIHKVVMDLTEGTEDAAPTAAVTVPDSLETPTIFSVDRPFMFFMINNENDTIIFQGRFVSP
ncbi:serpin B3-like [Leptodactylus fuscus]